MGNRCVIYRKLHNLTHPVLGRILMLHRVVEQRSDSPSQRELEVTPDFLEQTIMDYQQKGYTFISIDELSSLLTTHHSLSAKKNVCLTFDDGYQDNYDIAYPMLKRLEVPFAVYVTTGFIDNRLPMWWYRCESREQCQTCLSNAEVQQRERSYPGEQLGISSESLKALDADPLCTLGAHTVSHPRLDTLSLDDQQKEIAQSRQELEALLDHPIYHFSYPHGAYNADALTIVKQQSFRTALCAWGGTVRRGANPLTLPRIELRQP